MPTDTSKGILLLCSDIDVRLAVQNILDREGYAVLAAGDLGLAVDRLDEDPGIALLIVCSHIDSMTGHDAAMYLRNRRNGLRVLMLTGWPEDDGLRLREQTELFSVFPKPFAAADLIAQVKAMLQPGIIGHKE
jgi:DNA-binding response OmpR family regulator